MASINYGAREINVKIVYYGPGLSGKTTNLQIIHRKIPQEHKSDMVSLATETDRTLFFDFLPLNLGTIKGFSTKFQLYTVPGQVYYNATRKLVLRGVDGVVFVADSAPDKIQENLESFQNLEDNLAEYHYKREEIPIILQYNKRDLPNALTIDQLQQQINKYSLQYTESVANKGIGVFDALKLIGKIVIDNLNRKYSRLSRGVASSPVIAAPQPIARPSAPMVQQPIPVPVQQPIPVPVQQPIPVPVQQPVYEPRPVQPKSPQRMEITDDMEPPHDAPQPAAQKQFGFVNFESLPIETAPMPAPAEPAPQNFDDASRAPVPPVAAPVSFAQKQQSRQARTQIDEMDYSVYRTDSSHGDIQVSAPRRITDDSALDEGQGKKPKGFLSRFFNKEED
jgi:hypothetical protein